MSHIAPAKPAASQTVGSPSPAPCTATAASAAVASAAWGMRPAMSSEPITMPSVQLETISP